MQPASTCMHARTHEYVYMYAYMNVHMYVCTVCTLYSKHICKHACMYAKLYLPSLLILRGYAWKKYYRVWAPTFSSTFAPMYAFMYAPEQEQILSLEARPHFDENLEPTSITINRTEFRFGGRWLSHPIICGSRLHRNAANS